MIRRILRADSSDLWFGSCHPLLLEDIEMILALRGTGPIHAPSKGPTTLYTQECISVLFWGALKFIIKRGCSIWFSSHILRGWIPYALDINGCNA